MKKPTFSKREYKIIGSTLSLAAEHVLKRAEKEMNRRDKGDFSAGVALGHIMAATSLYRQRVEPGKMVSHYAKKPFDIVEVMKTV